MDPFRRWRGARKDRARCRALADAGIAVEVDVPYRLYGARSGVWPWVETGRPEPVVYSFGIGDNAAWERAVMERHGARVFAFDPTPVSVAWIEAQSWPEGWTFAPVGLAAFDGEMGFRAPRKGANYCPDDGPGDGRAGTVRAPVQTFASLIHRSGLGEVDVLKLDIEGGEYAVFDALAADHCDLFPVSIAVVLIEMHHGMGGHTLADTQRVFGNLREAGFRLFWISARGLEFGFVRADAVSSSRLRPAGDAPGPRRPAP